MNENTHPNSNLNVPRPNGDHRLRDSDLPQLSGTGKVAAPAATGSPAAPQTAATATSAPGMTSRLGTPPAPSNTASAPAASPVPAGTGASPRPALPASPTNANAAPAAPGTLSTAAAAAPALLDKVVQGAHDTVDGFADSAAPVVRRLGERVSAAEDAVRARAEQLRQTRVEWTAGMRTTVRDNPLVCVFGALALGALIARIKR